MDMQTFVRENKIKMDVLGVDENKNMPNWKDANHFKVTLKHKGRQYTTYFSQGYGIVGVPEVEDVLNCLAMDSCWIENACCFDSWTNEYGFDIYGVAERLKGLLGQDLYDKLLWEVEPL